MDLNEKINFISNWIKSYTENLNFKPVSLVVGVSGGVDSALTSTLCAKTGLKTIAISMPIKQNIQQHELSLRHLKWLKENFDDVKTLTIELDEIFQLFERHLKDFNNKLAFANSRSRLRMATLYHIAQSNNGLVVGGVDISPIADCTKSDVWEMASKLNIIKDIVEAEPTDGLWDDSRNDENQLGLSYKQIEEAMTDKNSKYYKKYLKIREPNLHKMNPIPVCILPKK